MKGSPPLLANKSYDEESVFKPEHLIREARRQKALAETDVPSICILDPDGDIVRWLANTAAPSLMRTGPATTPSYIASRWAKDGWALSETQ